MNPPGAGPPQLQSPQQVPSPADPPPPLQDESGAVGLGWSPADGKSRAAASLGCAQKVSFSSSISAHQREGREQMLSLLPPHSPASPRMPHGMGGVAHI